MRRSQVPPEVAVLLFAIFASLGLTKQAPPAGAAAVSEFTSSLVGLDEVPASVHPLPQRMLQPAPPGAALVLWGRSTVSLDLTHGDCTRTHGPFMSQPSLPKPAQALGLWSAQKEHIVCFTSGDEDFKFITSRFAAVHDLEERGDFGFGANVEVALRPEIATDAVWILQEGVRSLGLRMEPGRTLRVLAVRTSNSGEVSDMPVVVAQLPPHWPLTVHFTNSSLGKCKPDSGSRRLICRTESSAAGITAQLVALCKTCAVQPDQELHMQEIQGHPDVKLNSSHSWETKMSAEALAGWAAEVPRVGMWRRWKLTVQPSDAALAHGTDLTGRRLSKSMVQDVEVLLVCGESELLVQHMMEAEQQLLLHTGKGLAQVTMVSLVLLAVTFVGAAVMGLSPRLLAAVPAASATGLALQLLAVAGGKAGAPEALFVLSKRLHCLAPVSSPGMMLLAGLLTIIAVLVLHGIAVCWHIITNGRGSASQLPHSLKFGAWELWALSFLAFPLSAAATTLIVDIWAPPLLPVWAPTPGKIVASVPPLLILLALLVVIVIVKRHVSSALRDERVFCTVLPSPTSTEDEEADPIFVDRICDQLTAMPVGMQRSSLLGDWPAAPSWRHAPLLATIAPMEHCGGPIRDPSHWDWCGEWESGPWQRIKAPRDGGESEDDHQGDELKKEMWENLPRRLRNSKVAFDGLYRSVSDAELAARGFEGAHDINSMAARSMSTMISSGSGSAVISENPVSVRTAFTYRVKRLSINSVAGVRCLPWVDCVVPAKVLSQLENFLNTVALRVSAAQLVGPVTGGRLCACFHWGVRWPWHFSADMALKVVLGIWVALLPHLSERQSRTVISTHLAALTVAVGCCMLSIFVQPYVHNFDNAATVLARVAVVLGMLIRILGHETPEVAPVLAAAAAAVAAVPLGLLLATSCALAANVTIFSLSQKGAQGFAAATDQALRGQISRQNNENGLHVVDVILQDMHPGPKLPAWVRAPVVHYRLQPQLGRRGVCKQLESDGKPWVSLTPSLLFPTAQLRSAASRSAPIAALVEPPDEGRLLFAESDENGGDSWREVTQQFFGVIDESMACAREAEQIIQDFEIPQQAGEERTMVIVEAVPASTEVGTTIR